MALTLKDPKTGREIDYEHVTMSNGYWFFFDDGEDEIIAHGSSWTGKEWIYFNDDLVSEKRNISKRVTKHSFERNGHSYELVFNMTSFMQGQLECTLLKDGVEIGHDIRKALPKGGKFELKKELLKLIPFFVGGFIGGYFFADLFIDLFEKWFG